MAQHLVTFHLDDPSLGAHAPVHPVHVPTGTLLTEAAHASGVEIVQPCGGQGRCGRCAVHIDKGEVRRRSTLRLSAEDVQAGFALACQSVVEGNVTIVVPPQEIERRLTTDRVVAEVSPDRLRCPLTANDPAREPVAHSALHGRSDRRLEPPRHGAAPAGQR
jgi:ferredoxin